MPRHMIRPVAIKLDLDTHDRVKRLAAIRHRTPHWVMREAIQQYVEREERREDLHQEALQAWDAYQATGDHVTQAEDDAWLAQLESGHDVEPRYATVNLDSRGLALNASTDFLPPKIARLRNGRFKLFGRTFR